MKKLSFLSIILMICIIAMQSCKNESTATRDNSIYSHVDPEASFVLAFNPGTLITKSGRSEEIRTLLAEKALSVTEKPVGALMEKLTANPEESGFNINDDMIIYAFGKGGDISVAALASVTDRYKATETIRTLCTDEPEIKIEEAETETSVSSSGFRAAITNTTAILIAKEEPDGSTDEKIAGDLSRISGMDNSSSILTEEFFSKTLEKDADIRLWFDIKKLGETTGNIENNEQLMSMLELNGNKFAYTITFEPGRAVAEIAVKNAPVHDLTSDFSTEYLKYVPEHAYMTAITGIKNMKTATGIIMATMPEEEMSYEAENFIDAINSIEGTIQIAFNGLSGLTPSFSAFIETSDRKLFDEIIKYTSEMQPERQDENTYIFRNLYNTTLKYRDNKVIIATEDVMNVIEKGFKSNIRDARYADSFKSGKSALVIDVRNIRPVISGILPFTGNGNIAAALGKIDYLESVSASENEATVTMYFENRNSNSLKQICDIISLLDK